MPWGLWMALAGVYGGLVMWSWTGKVRAEGGEGTRGERAGEVRSGGAFCRQLPLLRRDARLGTGRNGAAGRAEKSQDWKGFTGLSSRK